MVMDFSVAVGAVGHLGSLLCCRCRLQLGEGLWLPDVRQHFVKWLEKGETLAMKTFLADTPSMPATCRESIVPANPPEELPPLWWVSRYCTHFEVLAGWLAFYPSSTTKGVATAQSQGKSPILFHHSFQDVSEPSAPRVYFTSMVAFSSRFPGMGTAGETECYASLIGKICCTAILVLTACCGHQALSSKRFQKAGKEVGCTEALTLEQYKSRRVMWGVCLSCKQWTVCKKGSFKQWWGCGKWETMN